MAFPQVEHTKFLDVIIDDKLTWQAHLNSLVKENKKIFQGNKKNCILHSHTNIYIIYQIIIKSSITLVSYTLTGNTYLYRL